MAHSSAILLLLSSLPAAAQLWQPTPELIRVNPHVYCATGYALGNVIFVLTDRSVVVVDTTEGQAPAQAALNDFRKVSALPINYIVYTHFHGDHINGAKVFAAPYTRVVAQQNHIEELRKYRLMAGYNRKLNQVQWAAHVPPEARGATLGVDLLHPPESGYIPPQITFDEQYKFTEGGVRFELYHTLGETVDHLMVWLPDFETLLPGDLFYWSFPMLASPGKPDRPVLEWAASLDRMRQLHPAYLVGSHSRPLAGREAIDQALANYARAIRYVHRSSARWQMPRAARMRSCSVRAKRQPRVNCNWRWNWRRWPSEPITTPARTACARKSWSAWPRRQPTGSRAISTAKRRRKSASPPA
jgi:glyoxylase-like metal-dependent hydrolase (beta-lactamase superfamily II)